MKIHRLYLFCIVSVLLVSGCTSTTPEVSDPSLTNIIERGTLVVSTYPHIDPMTYKDEAGNNMGHDIDMANEIAKELGVSLQIEELFFPDMLAAAKNGDVDLGISSITITAERSEIMLFSIPYFDAGQVIIVRNDTTDVDSPEDFAGKKIGVVKGTTGEKAVLALEGINTSLVISYDKNEDRDVDLKNGVIDLLVGDITGAVGTIRNNPELKVVGNPFTQEYYGIVTKLGNDALMERVNEILREMKRNGKLDELKTKWLK